MNLSALTAGLDVEVPAGAPDPEISSICLDSRRAVPGSLFVALPGTRHHGLRFLPQAKERGAVAVLSDRLPEDDDLIRLRSDRPRDVLARVSARFFGEPSLDLRLVGVTGTNGKTTVCRLLGAIADRAGVRNAVLGTTGIRVGEELRPATHTTPDAPNLQALLAELRDRDLDLVCMEVSSHALDQRRVGATRYTVAAFTQLSRDHLDYHGSMEGYLAAKRSFFDGSAGVIGPEAAAVVVDDEAGREIARAFSRAHPGNPLLRVSLTGEDAELRVSDIRGDLSGQRFTVERDGERLEAHTGLIGRHNVSNAALALAVAELLGWAPETAIEGLAAAASPEGRMERVALDDGAPAVFVDYAHTPDALAVVLGELRNLTDAPVTVVFGCGGDRDRGKRPEMGDVAARLAHRVVVTSDNPRSEDPQRIIEDILAGIPESSPAQLVVEPDRRRAIGVALRMAEPDGVVLLAGKGHERSQILADGEIEFDDVVEARRAWEDMT